MKETKRPTTRAEHQANHLKKQVLGHQRIIADLQEALRIGRHQMMVAEANREGALMAARIMEQIARGVIADLPEEQRKKWLTQMPWLGKEKENENCLEIHDPERETL